MPDLTIDTTLPVLVTGATGYVAGVLVKRLLDAGLTVHATVRDPAKTDRFATLQALADASPGQIRFFGADLLVEGSFAEAMAGCGVVFHVASPFVIHVADPQKELVDPAVNGTRNVLNQASATPSVKRVVVTSSCAAIYGHCTDLDDTPRGVFDEEVWNTSSSLDDNPYSYSKTMAEREAWRLAEAQDQWRLVVVNPSLVMGPGVRIHPTSESFQMLKQLGDGTMQAGVPDMRVGVVDVRDLAEAHVAAAFLPDAQGRHVISGHDSSLPGMADVLRDRFGTFKLPKRIAPKWLIWLVGPFINAGLTRDVVRKNIGLPWRADHGKSVRELGMTYRPLSETMNDFFQQAVEAGEIAAS